MARLPDVTYRNSIGGGGRPMARIDATPIAEGEAQAARAYLRSGEELARALKTGGEAMAEAVSVSGKIGRVLVEAGVAQGQSIREVGERAGRTLKRNAAQMSETIREASAGMTRARLAEAQNETKGLRTLGAGLQSAATDVMAIKASQDRYTLAAALSKFETGVSQLGLKYETDRDYATLPERFGKEVDELRNTLGGGVAHLRDQFDLGSQSTVNRTVVSATRLARTGLANERGRARENDLDELLKTGGAARGGAIDSDPSAKIDRATGLIDASVAIGDLTPEEARARKRKFANAYGKQWINEQSEETQLRLLPTAPLDREQWVDRTIGVESRGKATAKNPNSSAFGAGQFIKETWLENIKEARPDIAQGRSDAELLSLRADPALSRQMVGYYRDKNEKKLTDNGIAPTAGNLYLAHFLGPGGAVKVLKADPSTPVSELLPPDPRTGADPVKANRSILEGKTAGTVAAWADAKMGSGITGTPVDYLTDNERNEAYVRLQINIAARDKRRDELIDKGRKTLGDDALKEAYSRGAQGTLTPDFVEQVRPLVTATQYQGLLKSLGEEAASDDTEAIADLTQKIDGVTPEEFQKSAVDYLRRGKLKTSTYISLSEKNRSASKDDLPASPYKSGRELVKITLDPGQLLSGPAAAIARTSQAQAMTEFDNWSAANPRAQRADALAEAQNIIQRYQVVPFDQMKMAVGTSRYFGSKARNEIAIADVDTAEQTLATDIAAGTLTKAQQEFEVRLLNNWRGILTREQAQKEQQRVRPARP